MSQSFMELWRAENVKRATVGWVRAPESQGTAACVSWPLKTSHMVVPLLPLPPLCLL